MVRIGVELSGLTKGLEDAQSRVQKFGQKMQSSGAAMAAGITLPLVAVGGAAMKTAIDFESAFANVEKTVTATGPQFAALETGIRDMAKEIPKSAAELSNLAAIGGQFGVSTPALLGFTRTIADLGVAIDGISAEEAAAQMAQIGKVTGTTEAEFRNMGSTLVDLGNKGSASEATILSFTQRLAGSGSAIGLTAAEIMGIGASMANLGLNAEAGGTAMSKVFSKMEAAVARGGGGLENFARTAGLSAASFAATFQGEPAKAVQMFIDGLGKAKDQGQSLTLVLDDMEMKDVRLTDSLKRLAQSQGEMTKQIDIAKVAWKDNSALTDEAGKKYATTENRLVLLRNKAQDAAITIGGSFATSMMDSSNGATGLIDKLGGLANWFTTLSPGIQKTTFYAGAFLAAIGPVVWAIGGMASGLAGLSSVLATVAGWLAVGAVKLGYLGASLASIGPAIAIMVTAFASWKIGSWIGEITGLTDWIGKKLAGAFYGVSEAQYAASRAAANAATGLQLVKSPAANAAKGLEMTAEQAAHAELMTRNLTRVIPAAGGALAELSDEAKEAAKQFQSLVDSLSGKELFKQATDAALAVKMIGGAAHLTADEGEAMATMLGASIEKYKARLMTVPPAIQALHDKLTAMPALLLRIETNKAAAAVEVERLRESMQTWLASRPLQVLIQPSAGGVNLADTMEPFKKAVVSDLAKPGWMSKAGASIASQLGPTIMGAVQGGGDVGKSVGALLGSSLASAASKTTGKLLGKAFGSTVGGALNAFMPGLGALAGQLFGAGLSKVTGWIGGLFSNPMKKEVQAANAEIAKLQGGLLEQYGGMDALEVKANSLGLSFEAAWGHQGQAGLAAFKGLMDEFAVAVKASDDKMAGLKTSLKDAQTELGGLIDKAAGMGYVFNEQGELTGVTFSSMKTAASDLGINLEALGPAFAQAGLNEKAMEFANKIELLKLGGADMGGVLMGTKDKFSALVNEAIKGGLTLPENMKPWITELIKAGLLTDKNGEKVTDVTKIKFGAPVATEYEKITSAIKTVVDQIAGLIGKIADMTSAIDTAMRDRTSRLNFVVGDMPDPPDFGGNWRRDGESGGLRAMATGGVVFGPTRALVGEAGPEAVIPLDRLQAFIDDKGTDNSDVVAGLADLQRSMDDLPFVLARSQRDRALVG